MATVSLQTVFDSARRALETGAADKAIGIAQHILVHFPRMIEGHRLLGEAYLNANEPEQAAAAFEHVLQADPENVAAYYGLGLAQQSLDQRSAAITAFERALEIQPNLADLRTQLMRLYSETPGSAGQFRLSRAGLGRLYARGGMFGQAIDEFRAVLDADPERDDVKVALAEALWRDGQEDEATDFCRDVLDRRPDLLKPTVLLGYMLFAGGQPEGEALWRRAGEQDASMTVAHSLFDILPPIRLEEPVLSEFDEAEWRAQEARRAAEQPLQPSVAAVGNDDDFFADSWLSSTGSTPQPTSARIYDSPVPTGPSFAAQSSDDDDDLLASLLGFADTPSQPAASAPAADFGSVEPFGLDDWGAETSGAAQFAETLPSTLDDLALPDPAPLNQVDAPDSVKPFSFDDWSFEEDAAPAAPSASQPASQPAANEFDLGGVEAFSFDDDDSAGSVKPFSFDDDDSAESVKPFSFEAEPSGVTPFSLEDDDFGGTEPFSLDTPGSQASASAPSDAGLGAVQPFSFDEWGLDDNEPASGGASALGGDPAGEDDLGDFKPFSLDELSLDSLDNDAGSTLSGPQISDESATADDAAGFSWEEPNWRAQQTNKQAAEPQESESIFAKLMRNRPQEQPPVSTTPSEPPILDEGESTFFSLDEEPLGLDLDADLDALPRFESVDADRVGAAEPTLPDVADAPASATSDIDSLPRFEPTFDASAAEESSADASLADLALEGFDENDQLFSWEQPEQSASAAPVSEQEPGAFSLTDLGFSDDELAALDLQPTASPENTSATESEPVDMTPFSLADLGLSDDELAALDLQDSTPTDVGSSQDVEAVSAPLAQTEPAAESSNIAAPAADDVDMTPFSLADLGLSDDELAALDIQEGGESDAALFADDEPATEAAPNAEIALPPAAPAADDVDMTPFSLADLGLSDDELALFNETQQHVEAESAASPFAEFDLGAEEPTSTGVAQDAAPGAQQADWFDLPSTSDADLQTQQPIESFVDQEQPVDQAAAPAQTVDQPAATSDEPTPFSLADLGLSDDELALFEQIQSEQQEPDAASASAELEAPATEAPAASSAEPAFEWPFAQADQESPFAQAGTSSAAATPFTEADVAETSAPAFERPFAQADQSAGAETEQLAPFVEADATQSPVAETTTPDVSAIGDESAGATAPAANDAEDDADQPLPMELPEGAQSVAATADAQPSVAAASAPTAPAARPDTSADHGLAAIHAQLAADPENHAMRLAVARMSQQINNLDQAIEQYKQLIKRGELLDEVVDDLQDVIGESDDAQTLRRLHRLLGDAYMKQNRFREAMDEYSWTLARRN
jgi:tetratricopeptide (TPR) repeat protein